MVMGSLVGYPLEYYIKMLIGLKLGNSFGTWGGYFSGFSLSTVGLVIDTVKGCLVGLLLLIPLVYPLESPNIGLTGIILGMDIVNTLGYLIDYICNINWYGPCLGALQLFLHFYWIPSLPVI